LAADDTSLDTRQCDLSSEKHLGYSPMWFVERKTEVSYAPRMAGCRREKHLVTN